MAFDAQSRAAVVASAVQNVQFKTGAENVPRKILIIGTYDPAKTGVTDEVPVLITSAADAGDKFGFGFMVHRLALKAELGSQGVETWIQPQSETGLAAAGDIDFTGTTLTENGEIHFYIAGEKVSITGEKGDDGDDIATKCVAAVTADPDLPVTAAVGTPTSQVDFTSKSKGTWGNDISLEFNLGFQEEDPAGLAAAVTPMSGGTTVPDIDDALDGLGTGDSQNLDFFTDVVHGYGNVAAVLDKLSVYNGEGNGFTGNYSKTVARPFRVLQGDVGDGSSALTALLALADARPLDRTNGVIPVPGSPNHPAEIAAQTVGHMARINNNRAAQSYIGVVLSGVFKGAIADRWTDDYDSRDLAVKSGVSVTNVENNAIVLQNVLTYYHPASVPIESNGYISQRNISILQNILFNQKQVFSAEKWQGISIVADVTKVSNATDREKARDTGAVLDELVALATGFEGRAWIYTAEFTIEKLRLADSVVISAGGTGFDSKLRVLLSGEGGIFNTLTEFDTSLAVLLTA